MTRDAHDPVPLREALEDHSAEGAEILYSEPAPLIRRSVLVMLGLVAAALLWSFIGHADIIVSAPGVLRPEGEVRRVYTPAEGELEVVLVQVGDPVSEGDELARVRSRNAVQLAAEARRAELALAQAELEADQFPARLALMEQEAETLEETIRLTQQQLDQRILTGPSRLRREQQARLAQARGDLEAARLARAASKNEWDSYRALAGRGVSEVEVERKRLEYEAAVAAYQQAGANLRDLESRFIEEAAQDRVELAKVQVQLEDLRIQHSQKRMQIAQAPELMRIKLEERRAAAEAARRIKFDGSEGGGMLVVLAPVSGVVTEVAFTQPGDHVSVSTPLVGIAPRDARKVLKISINERDRGFLVEGQPVKLKFNAFPYQRHGFINGILEHISPTTQRASPNGAPTYRGQVSLERTHFEVAGRQRDLRFGMTALAEIVVRERRLIDMALDPLRGI